LARIERLNEAGYLVDPRSRVEVTPAMKDYDGVRIHRGNIFNQFVLKLWQCKRWIKKHLTEEKLLIPFDEETHAVPVDVVPSELSQERPRQLLAEALNRLPAKFREVLVLFEIERWSYRAIATALNVRLGTVMSRLNRARCRLQQELIQVRDREIEEEL
jgi:RNA polymerase sigma factor (sigma-70 family)